ncbi:unnamed protein product [Allacma fusca]|uniref:Uncharacterized protein n=1 Tax=Allacma fusca TaxID=39272 RepID=A0A8J2K103_9HEXA|nr:unnamed protein product [Allacma fusca]
MLFTCLREGGASSALTGAAGGCETPSTLTLTPNHLVNSRIISHTNNHSMMNGSTMYDDPHHQTAAASINGSSTSSGSSATTTPISSSHSPYSSANNNNSSSIKCENINTSTSSPIMSNGSGNGPLHIPAKRAGTAGSSSSSCSLVGYSHPSSAAWSPYPDSAVAAAAAAAAGGSSAAPVTASSFDSTPYSNPMSSSYYTPAAAASLGGNSINSDRGKHGHANFPLWHDYKYPSPASAASIADCQPFSSSSWCNYSPYAPARVPSHHMDSHGQPVSYLQVAAAAAAAEDRRSAAAVDPATYDSYALRNAYGAPDPMTATPYPPSGQYKPSLIYYS